MDDGLLGSPSFFFSAVFVDYIQAKFTLADQRSIVYADERSGIYL